MIICCIYYRYFPSLLSIVNLTASHSGPIRQLRNTNVIERIGARSTRATSRGHPPALDLSSQYSLWKADTEQNSEGVLSRLLFVYAFIFSAAVVY